MNIIFISLFSIFVLPQLPWWAVTITASMAGFLSRDYLGSAFSGFLCGLIPWSFAFLYMKISGADILIERVAQMIGVSNWIGLLTLTALIGGLIGSLGALCSFSFRRAFRD